MEPIHHMILAWYRHHHMNSYNGPPNTYMGQYPYSFVEQTYPQPPLATVLPSSLQQSSVLPYIPMPGMTSPSRAPYSLPNTTTYSSGSSASLSSPSVYNTKLKEGQFHGITGEAGLHFMSTLHQPLL